MKAFVLRSFGSPDQLTLTDVDEPVPAAGEVLVRVRATSVNPYDWHDRNEYYNGSPEGQAFMVYLYTAFRDCINDGICQQ